MKNEISRVLERSSKTSMARTIEAGIPRGTVIISSELEATIRRRWLS
jgi:hypothetical protein